MIFEDLLELTLQELLDNYCALFNGECGYFYGITDFDSIAKMVQEYDIDEYREAVIVEPIISYDLVGRFDDKIMDYDNIKEIMENLNINKKHR